MRCRSRRHHPSRAAASWARQAGTQGCPSRTRASHPSVFPERVYPVCIAAAVPALRDWRGPSPGCVLRAVPRGCLARMFSQQISPTESPGSIGGDLADASCSTRPRGPRWQRPTPTRPGRRSSLGRLIGRHHVFVDEPHIEAPTPRRPREWVSASTIDRVNRLPGKSSDYIVDMTHPGRPPLRCSLPCRGLLASPASVCQRARIAVALGRRCIIRNR